MILVRATAAAAAAAAAAGSSCYYTGVAALGPAPLVLPLLLLLLQTKQPLQPTHDKAFAAKVAQNLYRYADFAYSIVFAHLAWLTLCGTCAAVRRTC
jgi:hypothetical protein